MKQKKTIYIVVIKRIIDIVLSTVGLVILFPVFLIISFAIKLDSSGPIVFTQKRVGIHKKYFMIHKFRTMRIDTPQNVPTHMLKNPEQWITKVGRILRKTSLDELPQIYDIWIGKLSIIGPRPALWNQYDLIKERDKYGANDVMPGLTGWAQINGRDELEIPIKAKLDGEYVEKLSFWMDIKCFLGTIGTVLCHDGVIEGGTGEIKKNDKKIMGVSLKKARMKIMMGGLIVTTVTSVGIGIIIFLTNKKSSKVKKIAIYNRKKIIKKLMIQVAVLEGIAIIYANIKRNIQIKENQIDRVSNFKKNDTYSKKLPKRILITGANSYIGMSVEKWLCKYSESYKIDTLDMLENEWKKNDFSSYDVVYHVAGIAHTDIDSMSEEEKKMYYKVNTDLAVETAKKAKKSGVKQFIFMSSMIIYSGCKEKLITKSTQPKALNFYGDSKWQAEQKIRELAEDSFKVVILRPPMIYGKHSKGNYAQLVKLASKLPVFPIVKNKRSMIYIDNFCEFVRLMIDNEESGVFFPQNEEYTNTSDMVQIISEVKGHKIIMIPGMNYVIKLLEKIPSKIGYLSTKAFGNFVYDMGMSEYKEKYQITTLRQSIELSESERI